MAFADFQDAKRVLDVLGKRIARYELTLHPEKTRFVDFRSYRSDGKDPPDTDGTSFTFLGFCHVWGKSRKGKNVVRQVTAKKRYARAIVAVTDWCRKNRHRPIPEQHTKLVRHEGCKDLAEVDIEARQPLPMGPVQCSPQAASPAETPNRPSLHHRERSSPVKNRMLEIGAYGTVRGEGGNILTYSEKPVLRCQGRSWRPRTWCRSRGRGVARREALGPTGGQRP
jgi:hypothetical protein